jgi:hypothetical protein
VSRLTPASACGKRIFSVGHKGCAKADYSVEHKGSAKADFTFI